MNKFTPSAIDIELCGVFLLARGNEKSQLDYTWSFARSGLDRRFIETILQEASASAMAQGLMDDQGRTTAAGSKELAQKAEQARSDLETVIHRAVQSLKKMADDNCGDTFAARAASLTGFIGRFRIIHPEAGDAFVILLQQRLHDMLARLDSDFILDTGDLLDHIFTCAIAFHNSKKNISRPKLPSPGDIRWKKIGKDVFFGHLQGEYRYGPLICNLLEAKPGAVSLITIGTGSNDPPELSALASKYGCQHGTTGGFHLYAETGLHHEHRRGEPVGLIVTEGKVAYPPVFSRTALIQYESGHWGIVRISLKGMKIRFPNGLELKIRHVNPARIKPGEPCVFTRVSRTESPKLSGALVLAFIGCRIVEAAIGESVAIPDAGFVVVLDPAGRELGSFLQIKSGLNVAYELPKIPGCGTIWSAMAGGPSLIKGAKINIDFESDDMNGLVAPITYGGTNTLPFNFLPRLAYGVSKEHHLIAFAVEGRDEAKSVGLSLDGVARSLLRLGCVNAVNMDGGLSKRMLAAGNEVDLIRNDKSDLPGSLKPRAIRTAILWRQS